MILKELTIRNFRKLEDLTIYFPPGLSVIVGENNSGKTTIIDALRFMLFPGRDYNSLRLNEDDFKNNTEYAPIEFGCIFTNLTEADEVHFMECLVDRGEGKFDAQLNARIEYSPIARRLNYKMWGGETEGGTLSATIYDHIASVYLQPLRDPEKGLRPGRYSQVARLIESLTEEAQREYFESIVKNANDQIRGLDSVRTARNGINEGMKELAGEELAQQTELIFNDPTFHRIIAGLQPEIDELPFTLNGLGYNNLIFASTTLGTLEKSTQYSFRSILIEEPEAHLHPQLQVLLLRHFAKVAAEEEGNKVQVIASSHSPVLVSQAPIDSIISISDTKGGIKAKSIHSIEMESSIKKKLQRFLDATRAELFFAKRILMVEGIAEALLMPVLTKIAGGSLKESAITILNVDGINFNAFIPLFKNGLMDVPVVILTDGDRKYIGGDISDSALYLIEQISNISNIEIKLSEITFEHELARSAGMLPQVIDAFEIVRPQLGKTLRESLASIDTIDEKANHFLKVLIDSKTSKGLLAQELSLLLESASCPTVAVPLYIREALAFLDVIDPGSSDE